MKRKIIWLVLILLVSFNLACDDTDKANEITDEANVILTKRNELIPKYNKIFLDLFGEKITKAEDIETYKKENKPKFDELLSLGEQMEKTVGEIKGKYEQATKLQIDDENYKKYLNLKLQEWQKISEIDKTEIAFIKTFLETKDIDEIEKQISEFDKKKVSLTKESEKFQEQAEKIVKENPDTFDNK